MIAFKALTLALFAAGPALAAKRPSAEALLLRALSAPATAYRVVERVQVFEPGRKPRALRVTRLAAADGGVRLEIPVGRSKKAAPLVFTRRAGRSALSWPARGLLWEGPVADESAARALERLRSFYEMSVSTGGQAAKRRTWRVDLRDAKGRLRRALWVDRADGLLLKSESYRLDGTLHRRRRATRLEIPAPGDSGATAFAGAQRRLTWSQPERGAPERLFGPAAAWAARLPLWRPDGFVLIDLRAMAGGKRLYAGYGDGASAYTVGFESASAPAEPTGETRVVRDGGAAWTAVESEGALQLVGTIGDLRAIVTGDLPEDEMARVLGSVPGAR